MTARRCPICGRSAEPRFRPFCSARCADQDLVHWLRGDYRVPVQDAEEDPTPLDKPPPDV